MIEEMNFGPIAITGGELTEIAEESRRNRLVEIPSKEALDRFAPDAVVVVEKPYLRTSDFAGQQSVLVSIRVGAEAIGSLDVTFKAWDRILKKGKRPRKDARCFRKQAKAGSPGDSQDGHPPA